MHKSRSRPKIIVRGCACLWRTQVRFLVRIRVECAMTVSERAFRVAACCMRCCNTPNDLDPVQITSSEREEPPSGSAVTSGARRFGTDSHWMRVALRCAPVRVRRGRCAFLCSFTSWRRSMSDCYPGDQQLTSRFCSRTVTHLVPRHQVADNSFHVHDVWRSGPDSPERVPRRTDASISFCSKVIEAINLQRTKTSHLKCISRAEQTL